MTFKHTYMQNVPDMNMYCGSYSLFYMFKFGNHILQLKIKVYPAKLITPKQALNIN